MANGCRFATGLRHGSERATKGRSRSALSAFEQDIRVSERPKSCRKQTSHYFRWEMTGRLWSPERPL